MPKNDYPPKRSVHGQMFKGSIWMIAQRWAIRLTGVVSTIVLARLLTPSDFGIVAMAMIFVGMLEVLNQTGVKHAIIRYIEPTRAHYDTAWTLSVVLGLLVGTAIVILAPFTSLYFHEPRAVPVMQCLALRAAMGGFENVGIIDFKRDIRFDRLFLYNMYPKLVSFLVTIALAILWRNYWALVAGILSLQVAAIIASYVMHPYRPHFSVSKIGEIYSFSGWMLFRTIGSYLNTQIDQVAVGGIFGASIMGRYAVAADIAVSPIDEVNTPMVAVLYPVMASVQREPARLRELYLRTLCWSAIICGSTSVGVALVAHDMVRLVLGEKWLAAEPLMGWLALSAGLLGLSSGAYTVFDVVGKPHRGARMQWVRLIFLFSTIIPVALLLRSPYAIACTRMVVTAAFIPTLLVTVGREVGVSARDYFHALWRPFISAAFMALVVCPVNQFMPAGNLRLAFDIILGAASFGGALVGFWLASGRPDSPENDVCDFLLRILRAYPNRFFSSLTTISLSSQPGRKICLYVPISTAREYIPLPRSGFARLKAAALRTRDRIAWRLLGDSTFDFYSWQATEYTNRGDVAIRQSIRQLLEARVGEGHAFVELGWGELDAAALEWINASADIFVICGGGYVSGDALSGRLSRRMDDVAKLAEIRCPVVAFGIGYNLLFECPPADMAQSIQAETVEKLASFGATLDLVGVRDRKLQQMLEVVSARPISLIGDPALFLEPLMSGSLPNSLQPDKWRIGLNFSLHGPLSSAIFQSHFNDYVQFLKRIERHWPVTFFYFIHCDTERIAVAMLRARGVNLHVVDRPPGELITVYRQMDFTICQMLHSSILATNAGVPSINIGYDQKNVSFYELMGLPELCLPHDQLTQERLWEVLSDLIRRKSEIVAQLEKRKAALRMLTDQFTAEIVFLISDGTSSYH